MLVGVLAWADSGRSCPITLEGVLLDVLDDRSAPATFRL
jgi:hypothetical protein